MYNTSKILKLIGYNIASVTPAIIWAIVAETNNYIKSTAGGSDARIGEAVGLAAVGLLIGNCCFCKKERHRPISRNQADRLAASAASTPYQPDLSSTALLIDSGSSPGSDTSLSMSL